MKRYVRFCSATSAMLLVLHSEMLSPQPSRTKILSGFLRAMFAHCLLHLGSSKATLWLCWRHLGANFGDFGAVWKAAWQSEEL